MFLEFGLFPNELNLFSLNSEAYSREQTKIVEKIVGRHNGSDFVFVDDLEAKKDLWKVRHHSYLTGFVIYFIFMWIAMK